MKKGFSFALFIAFFLVIGILDLYYEYLAEWAIILLVVGVVLFWLFNLVNYGMDRYFFKKKLKRFRKRDRDWLIRLMYIASGVDSKKKEKLFWNMFRAKYIALGIVVVIVAFAAYTDDFKKAFVFVALGFVLAFLALKVIAREEEKIKKERSKFL